MKDLPHMEFTCAAFFEMPTLPPGVYWQLVHENNNYVHLIRRRHPYDEDETAPRLWNYRWWKMRGGELDVQRWPAGEYGRWYVFECGRAKWENKYVLARVYRAKIKVKTRLHEEAAEGREP